MKNKIKGLLALVLSVLIGQAWATDPVATWTDFRNLNSGEYTLTKDPSCTVNTDGSITLGGAGLTVTLIPEQEIYATNMLTIAMDISGVSNIGTLTQFLSGGEPIDLYYDGENLKQRYPKSSTDYGSKEWMPARTTIVLSYGANQNVNMAGTTTYVGGTSDGNKIYANGLKFTSRPGEERYITEIKFPADTGMTIHSLRLYSSKLTDQEVNEETNSRFTYVGGLDADNVVTIGNAINVESGKAVRTIGFLDFSNGGNAVNAGGTLEVVSGEVTFNAGNGSVNGTVNISEGATFVATKEIFGSSGAVTGAGKLVVNDYPNESIRTSLGQETWTGTYVNTANNTLQDNSNWLGAVGNANSIVEFTGESTGYLKQAGSMNAALKVTGSITFNNGFSDGGGYTFNGALLGDGTLATSGSQTDVLKFLGETKDFAGTITVDGGHCIAFGEQADNNTKQGKIVIAAGKTANIAAGKTWTAVNGIEVAGTIGGEGTIGSTLTLAAGATLAGAVTVTGNVTVEGALTITHADEAGETVITCANAEAVAAALTGAPEGLRYIAENGAVKLAAIPVAQIGETPYETLQEAITAAGADATVELCADTTENITIPAGFTATIDLGGKTLTGNVKAAYDAATTTDFILQNGYIITPAGNTSKGAIYVKNATVELIDIDLTANYHGIRTEVGGNVTIDGGRYESIAKLDTQYNVVYAKEDSTVTIEDGTFIRTPNGGTVYLCTAFDSGSTINIEGGNLSAGSSTFVVNTSYSGIYTISGGLFAIVAKNVVDTKLVEGYLGDETINPGSYTVAKAYNVAKTIDATKVTVTGLNDVYACGGKASFTVAAVEGFKVTGVTLDGVALTADENGKYTFTMPEKDVAIVITTEVASTFDVMINGQPVADADALKLAANSTTTMTVPETSTWTAEGNVLKKDGEAYVEFADYYTVVVNGTSVTLKLNKPVIGDSAEGADDAFTVTADAVTIKITNYNSALKYGVRSAADINGLKTAEITEVETEDGVITLTKSGDSAFFEVVVSDVDFPATPAE